MSEETAPPRGFWEVARTPRMTGLLLVLLLAAAGCGWLGAWQLDRAALRGEEAAAKAREEVYGRPPVPIAELLPPRQPFTADLVGRRVTVTGELTGEQLLVPGRVRQGEVGHLVLARMVDATTGALVVVVRGWQADDAAPPPVPTGEVTVTGYLQAGEAAGQGRDAEGRPLPAGYTDAVSPAQLAASWGTPVHTGYLVQSEPAPEPPLLLMDPPRLPEEGMELRNLVYAIEWWVFAAFAVAIWVRTVRDHARDPEGPGI